MNRKYVFLNNKGYTLLESIIGMFMLSIISLLILTMIMTMSKNNIDNYNQRNSALIINKMEKDFFGSTKYDVSLKKLTINTKQNGTIEYKCKNDKLSRSVNDKGNETVIAGIKDCKFVKRNGVNLELIFNNGDVKEVYIGESKL